MAASRMFVLTAALLCQLPATSTPADEPTIQEAVDELGHDSFEVRNRASHFLWQQGLRAVEPLQRAARSEELEVRLRAIRILEDFEYGILPDVPEDVLRRIREFRAGTDRTRQETVKSLAEDQHWDTITNLLNRESNLAARRVLLIALFQSAAAIDRYGTPEELTALVESVAPNQDQVLWNRTLQAELLFSPSMIERLARQDQLQALVQFLASEESPQVRSVAANSLFRDTGSLRHLMTSGQWSMLHTILEAVPLESRPQLIVQVMRKEDIVTQIIDGNQLDQLYQLLTKIYASPNAGTQLPQLFESAGMRLILNTEGIDSVLTWLKQRTEDPGASLAALVSSRIVKQWMLDAGKTELVVELATKDLSAAARREYLAALFRGNYGIASLSADAQHQLWELITTDEDDSWKWETLSNALRDQAMRTIASEPEEITWLLHSISKADAIPRLRVLQTLVTQEMWVSAAIEQGNLDKLLDSIDSVGDSTQQATLLSRIAQNPATVGYLRPKGQLERLITLAKNQTSATARIVYLQGLLANEPAITELVDGGHYEALADLILATEDAGRRASLFGSLVAQNDVVRHLSQQSKLKTLITFATQQDSAETRALYLRLLFRSDAITVLIQNGFYADLQSFLDEDSPSQDELAAAFYGNDSAIRHFLQDKKVSDLVALAESSGPAARLQILQRVGNNAAMFGQLVDENQTERFTALVAQIPEANQRAAVLGNMLASPEFISQLVAGDQLDLVLGIVQQESAPEAKLQLLRRLFSSHQVIQFWIDADQLERLVQLADVAPTLAGRADLLSVLVNAPLVLDHWSQHDQLGRLLELADSFGEAEARDHYLQRLYENSHTLRKLIEAGLFEELVEAANREPAKLRGSWLGRLAQNPATAPYHRAQGRVLRLLTVATDEADEAVRQEYLTGLVYNGMAISLLVDGGFYDQLYERILSLSDVVERSRLFGRLTQHSSVVAHLSQRNLLPSLLAYAETQADEAARTAFLQSLLNSAAFAALLKAGHYGRMQTIVEQESPHRGSLAALFYSNPLVLSRHLEANEFDTILQHIDSLDQTARLESLRRIMANAKATAELIRAGRFEKLVSLIRGAPTAAERGHLLGRLFGSPEVLSELAAKGRLQRIIELAQEDQTPNSWQMLATALASDNAVDIWVRAEMLDPLTQLVLQIGDQRQQADLLARLASNESVLGQWEKQGQLTHIFAPVESLGGEARQAYTQRILTNAKVVSRLIAAGHWEDVLMTIGRLSDPQARATVLASLVRDSSLSEQLAKAGLTARLFSFAREQPSALVRQRYLHGLIYNRRTIVALVEEGQYEPLAEWILSIGDATQRATYFGLLTQQEKVVELLSQNDKLGTLVEFAEGQELPEAQTNFLQPVFASKTLGLLIEQGYHDRLEKMLDKLSSDGSINGGRVETSVACFYSNPKVFDRLQQPDGVVALVQRVSSMKSAQARYEFLYRSLSNHDHLARLIDSDQTEALATMIGRDPDISHRQHLFRQLVTSSGVIDRLTARRDLPRILGIIRGERNSEVRGDLIERLATNTAISSKLVEAGLLPDLLSLIKDQPSSKKRGEWLGKLLGSSTVTEHLIERGDLKTMLQAIQQGQQAEPHAVRSLIQALVWDRRALTRWVDAGMLDALIEVIAADKDLDERANMLGRLVTAQPVLDQWRKKEQLGSILELAESLGDNPAAESRRKYLGLVFNSGAAVQKMVEAGVFEELLEQLLDVAEAAGKTDPQRTLLASLLQSASAAEHLSREGKIDLMTELVRREEPGPSRTALLAAVLRNPAAVTALIDAERFESLIDLAQQFSSPSENKAAMVQFLYSRPAVQYLAEANKLEAFVRALLDDLEHDLRSDVAGDMLRQGPALVALDRGGMLDDVLQKIESFDAVTRDDLLSRIVNAPGGALLLVQHDRLPLVISVLEANTGRLPEGSTLRTLLGEPQFLRALADKDRLGPFLKAAEGIDQRSSRSPGFRPSLWESVNWSSEALVVLAEHDQLEWLLTFASENSRPVLLQTLLRNLLRSQIFDSLERPRLATRLVELTNQAAEQDNFPAVEILLSNKGLRQTLLADGQQNVLLNLLPRVRHDIPRERLRQQILESAVDLMLVRISRADPTEARRLLEKYAAESQQGIPLLVTYLRTQGGLEQRIKELQAHEDTPPQLLAYLHRANGNLDAALTAAAQSGDAALLHYLRCEAQDWRSAAEQLTSLSAAPPVPMRGADNQTRQQAGVERLGLLAAYWRLAGDADRTGEVFERIEQFAAEHQGDRELQRCAARALLLNHSLPQALTVLQRADAVQAFEALVARHQYSLALEAIGCVPGSTFDQKWFLSFPQAEKSDPFASGLHAGQRRIEIAIRIAEIFQRLGLEDDAQQILRTVEAYIDAQPERTNQSDSWKRMHRQWLAAELYRIGFRKRAYGHAQAAITEPVHERLTVHSLFDGRGNEAIAWWMYFKRVAREEAGNKTVADRLRRIHAVMHLQAAQSRADFEQLIEQAASTNAIPQNEMGSYLAGLAETCIDRTRPDLAERLLWQSDRQDWPTRMKLGLALREQQKWAKAGEVYMGIWQTDREQLASLYLSGDSLVHAGEIEEGERRKGLADLLALSSLARFRMAAGLAQAGLMDEAVEQWRIVSCTAPVASWEWYESVRSLADAIRHSEPTQAADLWEQYTLSMLRTSRRFHEPKPYLRMPYIIRWRRAVAALPRQDPEEVLQQARRALEVLPGGVELVHDLVPGLEAIEADDAINQLHDSVRQPLLESLRQFPESPYLHNEVAWLDARCHRHLDEALEHAARAVEARPGHAGYIDTLAEVYFQRGDRERAIELSQQSVKLAPQNKDFQNQLERFRNEPLPSGRP